MVRMLIFLLGTLFVLGAVYVVLERSHPRQQVETAAGPAKPFTADDLVKQPIHIATPGQAAQRMEQVKSVLKQQQADEQNRLDDVLEKTSN